MKKTIIIIICVLVLLGAVAAGLILFLPHNETIHIENPFVKTHIADAEVQGDMPEGTKLDTVIDITPLPSITQDCAVQAERLNSVSRLLR